MHIGKSPSGSFSGIPITGASTGVTKAMTPRGFPGASQIEGFCDVRRDRWSPELSTGNANETGARRCPGF
jgi:hypothetical protein